MENLSEQLLNSVLTFVDNPFSLFIFLFILAFANSFFPLVPIEILSVFCGYLVAQKHGSILVIIAATSLGMYAGSVLCYRAAHYYGVPVLKRPLFARYVKEGDLNRPRRWVEKYGAVSLFFAKFVPGVYLCAVISSGILALKKSKIYPAFFLANFAQFLLLTLLGKFAGEHWRGVYSALGKKGAFFLGALLLTLMAVGLIARVASRQKQKFPDVPTV
jgi:membrane protein DedA with SNARE-associated domain